jgi:polysaccharide export outer membrane protein
LGLSEKKTHKNTLNIFEALSINGGLNRTVDRKMVEIHRKSSMNKNCKIDLARQDVMNFLIIDTKW